MSKRTKIQWLTKSPTMQAFVNGDKSVQLSGGRLYEIQAMNALNESYDVSINDNFIKRENALKFLLKNHTKTIDADVCVLDPYILAYGKFSSSKKNVAIVHHIDESLVNESLLGRSFLNRMISNLKKVDIVVVVSEYWKHYLENKGIENIEIIYNSYDLGKFKFDYELVQRLRENFDFDYNKPVIYLGKLGSGKGIDEVLNSIDVNKYNLVVTGKTEHESNLITTRFFSEDEFPVFLSLCDVVLAMSTMQEGWNRITHESLLVKTPVIGSGSGGMRELLTKSGQIIVDDFNHLDDQIQFCLKSHIAYGKLGFEYVKQFDLNYFANRWNDIIKKVS